MTEAQAENKRRTDRAYREAHRDELREYFRRHYAENREKQREKRAIYRAANRERNRERDRLYRMNNREKVMAREKRWAQENREKVLARNARRRARKRSAPGEGWTAADVKAQHAAQRGRCFYCHCTLGSVYHRDHITPLIGGGAHCRSNLALACPTCNQRKNRKGPQEFAGILL